MIRHLPPRGTFGVFVAGIFLLTTGCGGGKVGISTVAGKVSYKGKPLTVGTIEFHGSDGKVSSSSINPDGTFLIPDAPVGDDTVVVRVPAPNPKLPPGHPSSARTSPPWRSRGSTPTRRRLASSRRSRPASPRPTSI